MARWKIAGINFEHFHMGDNLRMAAEHPNVEIVGLCDNRPERMQNSIEQFGLRADQVFTDFEACLEQTRPDVVLLCPAAAGHGDWIENILNFAGSDDRYEKPHILIEKPMAASLAEADRMTSIATRVDRRLAINWPMTWYPPHRTAHRLIQEGQVGEVIEVHYYDGNRGPLYHTTGKLERTAAEVAREKPNSWFYQKVAGGGSLLDYLGYGSTLATWFNSGQVPLEVTAVVDEPTGLEVDEHCIAIARYANGLSKFETRWGTFTDPWTHQPQPKCGFVIVGSQGTVSCYDYASSVKLQTTSNPQGIEIPADTIPVHESNPVQYFLHVLENNLPIEGPLSCKISRIGQQIVDTAIASAASKKTLPLLG